MNRITLFLAAMLLVCCTPQNGVTAQDLNHGKTLVVYYSYTNNCHGIVESLKTQITADILRVKPQDKTQKYEADNYAIGTQLLNAIKANPAEASSYPAIDQVSVTDLSPYHNIIIVTPLWWSQMAAIMQTYLFHYGPQIAGKLLPTILPLHSTMCKPVLPTVRLIPSPDNLLQAATKASSSKTAKKHCADKDEQNQSV